MSKTLECITLSEFTVSLSRSHRGRQIWQHWEGGALVSSYLIRHQSGSCPGHSLLPHATGILLYSGFCPKDDSGAEKESASVLQQSSSLSGSRNGEESVIDNPYLRPVKKPKIRRKKSLS